MTASSESLFSVAFRNPYPRCGAEGREKTNTRQMSSRRFQITSFLNVTIALTFAFKRLQSAVDQRAKIDGRPDEIAGSLTPIVRWGYPRSTTSCCPA